MIFSRGRKQDAIVEFWAWWPSVRPAVTAAIAGGGWGSIPDDVSRRVHAIHKDLTWEFSAGRSARHALVVSAGGDAELRATAARWAALAPAADPEFEYHTSRQPDHSTLTATIEIGGQKLDLAELRFAFERDGDAVDVVCHHPGFRRLPETIRGQVTFLALDWLLGEEGVETWIGAVEFAADEPDGARDPLDLVAAVDALREEHREPKWVIMRATPPDAPVILAAAARPLRSVRWPRFDTYVGVTLPYEDLTDAGLPDEASLAALRDFEDGPLATALRGDGELVAHESSGGKRTLHYYVDGATTAGADLAAAAAAWSEGRSKVERRHDPSFEAVAHLA
ncbi:DUF695 domain-containing protein [Dactylosporangium sp. NPDC000521]|uniref:DUF695 domain-containing protein n=1 Tax=Dactylosporangium sp. NPDC000521 TaxID=3363975 RepID=UPI00367E557F